MLQLLEHVDTVRREVGRQISRKHKSEWGQFMTSSTVAHFMASLFEPSTLQTARLLDAGAGIGSLSAAFLNRWVSSGFDFQRVNVVSYEIDANMRGHLARTLAAYPGELDMDSSVLSGDFIEEAVKLICEGKRNFTHAILNPPYKKINSASRHRLLLRQVGIETVNLYSAFVALALELMQPGGQIVAIIPRSFCNGLYYRPFRELILSKTAIKHLHLFGSRDRAFKDDDVLQENIIILLERDAPQGDVTISTSTDDRFFYTETYVYPFGRIVFPDDAGHFIHIPTSPENNEIGLSPLVNCSLTQINLQVSTGPVVDFRLKEHLRQMPEAGSVPLLYPHHFSGGSLDWPKQGIKKPNAIMRNDATEKWFYPNGCYVVVRRFSSKEEKRRITASMVYPDAFNSPVLGFENHLNIFHCGKQGLAENVALGLSVFLNGTAVDGQFRRFSGHTQVNATDLRQMKYPSRDLLAQLGIWARNQNELDQETIDRKIASITWPKTTTSKTL
ncbi:MAG: Eco57I restriction-modification methylase domain-containing protein [Methylovulum sp.]|nr:Eco57I restriction-modification methylase domain-containing protein [Methylovulum sp.]